MYCIKNNSIDRWLDDILLRIYYYIFVLHFVIICLVRISLIRSVKVNLFLLKSIGNYYIVIIKYYLVYIIQLVVI